MKPCRTFATVLAVLLCCPWLGAQGICTAPEAEIFPSHGTYLDYFGGSCSLEGPTAVVGAPHDESQKGSAEVFTSNGTAWAHVQQLLASDRHDFDLFGWSLQISGDTLVIGAPRADAGGVDAGAAYVFRRSGGVWSEVAKLLASDAVDGGRMGESVAIEGDTIVVGGTGMSTPAGIPSGAAYVFTRAGTTWTEQAKLVPSDAEALDEFGSAVAISAGWIVVGSRWDDDACPSNPYCQSGSAYLFLGGGASWSEFQKLRPVELALGHEFGAAVSLSGDRLVVGAPQNAVPFPRPGAAFLFEYDGASWVQQPPLATPTGLGDNYGWSVGIDADTIVIGARFDDTAGHDRGVVYTFEHRLGGWTTTALLFPCALFVDAAFGSSVAISGDKLLVGASEDAGAAAASGSAYVFPVPQVQDPIVYCTAKLNACGALPAISASGWASASAPSGFTVSTTGAASGKHGLLLYTEAGRAHEPFQGGTLCIPLLGIKRSVVLFATGGSPGACNGTLAIDVNAFASGWIGGDPSPVLKLPGTRIYAQFWGRDEDTDALLSDAVSFLIYP